MRRTLLASFTLIALGWMSGCSGSSGTPVFTGPVTPNVLTGQYAFVLAGYDSATHGTGNPLGIAGSFKADGLGNITGGEVDVNDNGTHSTNVALAGTYTIDANQQGIITLTSTVSGFTNPLKFGFSLQANGTFGNILSLDNNSVAAGTIQQQNSAVFSLAALANSYIITMNGRNASSPASVLGRFTLGSAGTSTNVTFDRSIAGLGTAGPTAGGSSAVTITAPDTNGRGTMTVAINDIVQGNTSQTFAYYAISSNRFIAVETDANGTMTADASLQQNGGFTANSVNTFGAVFGMAGIDTVANNEIAAVGLLQIASQTAGTLGWDSNNNVAIVSIPTLGGQTVAFDPITGRGTISGITSGSANGLANSLVFYLTAPGAGFIMDSTAGTTNRAMAGPLTAQVGSSFSPFTDFTNTLAIVRARGSSINDAQAFVGLFGPASTGSTYAFLADERNPGATPSTAVSIPGVTITSLSATTGRGTMVNSTSSETLAFYVIGVNQFVFIDITPVGSVPQHASPVFFASPH